MFIRLTELNSERLNRFLTSISPQDKHFHVLGCLSYSQGNVIKFFHRSNVSLLPPNLWRDGDNPYVDKQPPHVTRDLAIFVCLRYQGGYDT